MAEFGESRQPLIDKLHGKAQEKNVPDVNLVSRRKILAVAPLIAAGLAAFPGSKYLSRKENTQSPTREVQKPSQNNETFRIVLSPEQMELGQEDGNFDALKVYQDAPFLSYNAETNSGNTTDMPEVLVVEMTSYNDQIVFRKGPAPREEGSVILTRGTPDYDEIYKSRVGAVRLLGSEYGDSNSPGRLHLPPGEQGGAWFAVIGAEKTADGDINYHYADLKGGKLPPGEAPLCFSATFGNRVLPT